MASSFAARIVPVAAALALVTTSLAAAGEEHKHHEMTPAQQAEMEAYAKAATPGDQHAGLAATVGSYDLKIKSWMDPSAPPMESTGTATRAMMLGGRVVVEDMTSSMMGMPFTGHGLFGYDNVSKKYWSTWNDTMSTGIAMSEGTCDAAKACEFRGSWNDPVKGVVKSRMTTRWTSPTTEIFEMYAPGTDGKEAKMMEITYTKK